MLVNMFVNRGCAEIKCKIRAPTKLAKICLRKVNVDTTVKKYWTIINSVAVCITLTESRNFWFTSQFLTSIVRKYASRIRPTAFPLQCLLFPLFLHPAGCCLLAQNNQLTAKLHR